MQLTALAALRLVQWEEPGNQSSTLHKQGIKHGFAGKEGCPYKTHHARQVHRVKVVEASEQTTGVQCTSRIEADGIFTKKVGEQIAVKTADCLPILVADPGKAVAAIHAGWRGLTSGVISWAMSELSDIPVSPSQVWAAVGPAISREHYEVGEDVISGILSSSSGLTPEEAALVISKGKGDRWHVDLAVAAVFALIHTGIPPEHIAVVQACTFTQQAWYSFRRDGQGTGSNWSWIEL